MNGSLNSADSRRRGIPLEQLVSEASVVGDTRSLQNRWAEFVGHFGAESYWIIPYSPEVLRQPIFHMPRITIAHNVPSGWHEHYREQGFVRHDPVIKKGLAGGTIFTGAQAIDEFHSPEATRILAEARNFGVPDARGHVLLSLGFAPEVMLWATLCLPSADIHLDARTKLMLKTALFLFYARYQELKPAVPLVTEAPPADPP
jgi:hypothetical protein